MNPAAVEDSGRWRAAGDRIQTLLDGCAAAGPAAAARAEQLVREVSDLYGAALSRVVNLYADNAITEQLARDDLVASLLLVHGLHPHDVRRRVAHALETVRPYLGSHGGDVQLLEINDQPEATTVRLAFTGSCRGCPSSAITLELTVQDAIRAAAPEVTDIEVVTAEPATASPVIPAEALLARVHPGGGPPTDWLAVTELDMLDDGEVGGFTVAGRTVLACRVEGRLFAYLDRCPGCLGSMAGAALSGPVLRCPTCHSRYDVIRAGTAVADSAGHLQPVPVLIRDGEPALALPAEAMRATGSGA